MLVSFCLAYSSAAVSAPESDLWPVWNQADASNQSKIDHQSWQRFLDLYLVKSETGVNLVRYGSVSDADKKMLKSYLSALQSIDPRHYVRPEQTAYWINLYNALTVDLILDHYPVESIKDISLNLFSFFGPWDDAGIDIAGTRVSLNDIEHRILRPINQDARLHFVLNCASIGCPNLQPEVLTAANLDAIMDRATLEYLTHPRGASWNGEELQLSSIFEWYSIDFGDSENDVKRWIASRMKTNSNNPDTALLKALHDSDVSINYEYDWTLNSHRQN